MPLPTSIDVEDLEQVLRTWATEISNADYSDAILSISPVVFGDFDDHFQNAQGPDGAWPPRKRAYSHPILRKTGDLHRAATQEGAPGNIKRFSEGWGEFGADGSIVNYAGVHEYGTELLPPRPWAWLSSDAEDEAAEQLANRLYAMFD